MRLTEGHYHLNGLLETAWSCHRYAWSGQGSKALTVQGLALDRNRDGDRGGGSEGDSDRDREVETSPPKAGRMLSHL